MEDNAWGEKEHNDALWADKNIYPEYDVII